ncbi:SusC/RagA family TonB-linked outer membrane protein [Lunatimonas salinarum]|uniref:SusC/RagA family TonB-linked outer membrane protein n=1 Tax=Lunatimonas salinarum TaxID=1774590 RepID=UPI001AE04D59|nr:SusC/RagA family TonB-linked outer membrane protein [Lunatimonas salinarum]
MKNKLLKAIYMLSRYFLYGFTIQLLFLNLGLAVNANGQYKSIEEVNVRLSSEGLTVGQFFREVQRQTPFKFSYDSRIIDRMIPLSFSEKEGTLEGFLKQAARQGELSFRQYNHSIDVLRDERSEVVVEADDPITIMGKVTDENNEPLPGATISVRGTSSGTVTDIDGNFSLAVEEGQTIVISYIGYVSQTRQIGTQSNYTIVLVQDSESLDEVVVTAFGIERQEKALSYSVQKLEGKELAKVNNPNLLNGLQGKVAGVTVRQTSGAPGSSPIVNIRGSRSITGNNEPLYVVDGLPISGRPIDLNPNDIESLNVLKGPNAAALYGIRASNGVVVITTKRGKDSQLGKPTVTIDNGYNVDVVTRYPELQTQYAQGEQGEFRPFSTFSWGPRIQEMGQYTNQLGELEQAAVYDNMRNFFRPGGTYNANVEVANRFEKGNFQIGASYTDQKGTIENSGFKRYNLKFATDYALHSKVRVSTSVNFSSSEDDRIVDGAGNSSLFYASFFAPVSYDLKNKPIATPSNPYQQINFRGGHDNIYWSIRNNSNNRLTYRTFGNVLLDYKPTDWLTFNYRVGMDYFNTQSKEVLSLGSGATGGRTVPPRGGRIVEGTFFQRQFNSTFNMIIDKSFGEDFRLNFMAGNELFDFYSRSLSVTGNDFTIGGFHHLSNTATQFPSEGINRSRVAGFYTNLALDWKDLLFLNASLRNDVVSNMPAGNRSFLYPSVGLGFAFSELLGADSGILDFGKVRVSVAEVGQAGPLYVSDNVFLRGQVNNAVGAGAFVFPFEGITAFRRDPALTSLDIVPENTRTTEFGIDMRFFNRRIGIDYTYYRSLSQGQIFRVPVAVSTGFSSELRNAGQMSVRGHEFILDLTPIIAGDFRWNILTNFTAYENTVDRLAEGIERLNLGGFRVNIVAEEGQSYPTMLGSAFARDPQTNQIVVDSRQTLPNGNPNPQYGMPLRSSQQINYLGRVIPDFEFGFINKFTYKFLSLDVQVDWRQGGKIASGSNRLGKLYGSLAETGNREEDLVFEGVKGFYQNDGTLVVEGTNDIVIKPGEFLYRNVLDQIIESNVYDASFVRLREVRLSCDIPSELLERLKVQRANVYLTGRNLWLNAALPNFDPELNSGGGNLQGEEYLVFPQIASYGAGIVVSF